MNDWPTRMRDMQRTGHATAGPAPPLKLLWKAGLRGRDNYIWGSPIVQDEVVYCTLRTISNSTPQCLHAISINDGSTLWRHEGIRCDSTGSATFYQDSLFVCDAYGIYSLDPSSGLTRWQYPVGKLMRDTAPAAFQNIVFAGSTNGFLYALDTVTGELLWEFNAINWVPFSPSFWNHKVFIGTTAIENTREALIALNASTGEVEWKHEFEGDAAFHYNTTAAIQGGLVMVAVERFGLCAFDADVGDLAWVYRTKHGPFTAPCATEDMVIVAAGDPKSGLHAVDLRSGERIWMSEPGPGLSTSGPIIAGDYVFIGGGYWPAVYVLERATGEKVWEYKTGDIVFSTPAIAHGRLLIGCHDGYLYCFGEG